MLIDIFRRIAAFLLGFGRLAWTSLVTGETKEDAKPAPLQRTAIEALEWQLSNTARSRFRAAKRLEKMDRDLTRLTAFTSAYLIIIAVLPYFWTLSKQVANNLSLITIAMSVVILVSSLLQFSSNNSARAEQHHRSSLEMNEIKRWLSTHRSPQDIETAVANYNTVLQKYSINHEDVDFEAVQLERAFEHSWMTFNDKAVRYIRVIVASETPNLFLATVTIFFITILVGYAFPASLSAPG